MVIIKCGDSYSKSNLTKYEEKIVSSIIWAGKSIVRKI